MSPRLPAAARGFTMVELMVAMTLGLILTVVIGQVFVTSKESYRTTEDLSRLQENARFAVTQMSRVIRMAAFMTDPLGNRAAIFPAGTPAVAGVDPGGTLADEVTVRYQGSGAPDNTVFDCQGNALAGGIVAAGRFYLAAGADGNSALFCETGGGTIELVSGVDNMQVLYGEDTDADGTANRYLPRGSVGNMDNVVSVRIALLLRTTNEIATAPAAAPYNLLGTAVPAFADRRLRRVYTTTIALRNRTP